MSASPVTGTRYGHPSSRAGSRTAIQGYVCGPWIATPQARLAVTGAWPR